MKTGSVDFCHQRQEKLDIIHISTSQTSWPNEDGERRLLPPKTMAAIFLQKEAQEPLKNQNITAIGGPTQRSIYKDPTRPPQGNTPITDTLPRTKAKTLAQKTSRWMMEGEWGQTKDMRRKVGQYRTGPRCRTNLTTEPTRGETLNRTNLTKWN